MAEKTITAYVELLDEGSNTWRPTEVQVLGNGLYKLLPTKDYNPEDEAWAFLPGDTVRISQMHFANNVTGWAVVHSNPDVIRIDVEQEDNDAFSLRGTHALHLGNGKYEILPTPHYNPQEQHWKFLPSFRLRLKNIVLPNGFTALIPYELAE